MWSFNYYVSALKVHYVTFLPAYKQAKRQLLIQEIEVWMTFRCTLKAYAHIVVFINIRAKYCILSLVLVRQNN